MQYVYYFYIFELISAIWSKFYFKKLFSSFKERNRFLLERLFSRYKEIILKTLALFLPGNYFLTESLSTFIPKVIPELLKNIYLHSDIFPTVYFPYAGFEFCFREKNQQNGLDSFRIVFLSDYLTCIVTGVFPICLER